MKFEGFASLVLTAVIVIVGNAQESILVAPVRVLRTPDGKLLIGPDPNIAYERYQQLAHLQVQKDLELSDGVIDAFTKHEKVYRSKLTELRSEERAGRIPKSIRNELMQRHFAEADEYLNELLTPPQNTRLTQLLYRMEVSRIGLAESLVQGRLSEAVGVYENQKSGIVEKGKKIREELQVKIEMLTLEAENKLLDELAPEQRAKAVKVLGSPFVFEELSQGQEIYRQLKSREVIVAEGETP